MVHQGNLLGTMAVRERAGEGYKTFRKQRNRQIALRGL